MKEERFSQQPLTLTSPSRTLPTGSCDCHAHIFPAADLYPTFNEEMPLAPVELYWDIRHHLGFQRGVLVQGGAYRHDNRAMVEALRLYPDTLRGVALVNGSASEELLADLWASNVRALRFTKGGASRIADLHLLAPRMRAMGFHAELFLGLDTFHELGRELRSLDLPLVLDHLAGPFKSGIGVNDKGFRYLLDALKDGGTWVKLCPQRNSSSFPDYEDVRPYFDALVEARPDRLVWGSDWPHPNMGHATPNDDALLSTFLRWAPDAALQRRILVENAARLYDFP